MPLENKYWALYILCRKASEIIFAPTVAISQVVYLDLLISEHHQLLVELTGGEFTPKCHYLSHYPRLLSVYGPLRNLWCMRFEGYHQYLKTVAQQCGNFKNICHTLVDRNQMRKCLEQCGTNCLQNDEVVTCLQNGVRIRSLEHSLQTPVMNYFGCSLSTEVISVKSVVLSGVHYTVKDALLFDVLDGDIPVFFVVRHMFSFDGIWGLAGNLLTCSRYISHYHAYVVSTDTDWLVVSPGTELSHTALDVYKVNISGEEQQMIALCHSVPN